MVVTGGHTAALGTTTRSQRAEHCGTSAISGSRTDWVLSEVLDLEVSGHGTVCSLARLPSTGDA